MMYNDEFVCLSRWIFGLLVNVTLAWKDVSPNFGVGIRFPNISSCIAVFLGQPLNHILNVFDVFSYFSHSNKIVTFSILTRG